MSVFVSFLRSSTSLREAKDGGCTSNHDVRSRIRPGEAEGCERVGWETLAVVHIHHESRWRMDLQGSLEHEHRSQHEGGTALRGSRGGEEEGSLRLEGGREPGEEGNARIGHVHSSRLGAEEEANARGSQHGGCSHEGEAVRDGHNSNRRSIRGDRHQEREQHQPSRRDEEEIGT